MVNGEWGVDASAFAEATADKRCWMLSAGLFEIGFGIKFL